MAHISQLRCSSSKRRVNINDDFVEVILNPGERADNFVLTCYFADGNVNMELPLRHPQIDRIVDRKTNAQAFVISARRFPFFMSHLDPCPKVFLAAFALCDVVAKHVADFRHTPADGHAVIALEGAAAGATSTPMSPPGSAESEALRAETVSHANTNVGKTQQRARKKPAPSIACFGGGTRIRTQVGHRPIETLQEGDMVWTHNNGMQPLRWIGKRQVHGTGAFAPVQFAPETFGALKPHIVSQNQRILLTGWRAQLGFGAKEILRPAIDLVDGRQVRVRDCEEITYYHLLFDTPQILSGDGILSESFWPDPTLADAQTASTHREMVMLFPELATGVHVRNYVPQKKSATTLGPLLARPI